VACELQEVVSKLKLKPDELVLDVGCGLGGAAFLMAQVLTKHALFTGSRAEEITEYFTIKCRKLISSLVLEIIVFVGPIIKL